MQEKIAANLDKWQMGFTEDWNILHDEIFPMSTPCKHCRETGHKGHDSRVFYVLPTALVIGHKDDGYECGIYVCLDCVLENIQEGK